MVPRLDTVQRRFGDVERETESGREVSSMNDFLGQVSARSRKAGRAPDPRGRGVVMRSWQHTEVIGIVERVGIVPVVTLNDENAVQDLCDAPIDGGSPLVEIALRTPAAIPPIRTAAADARILVGAGTALSAGRCCSWGGCSVHRVAKDRSRCHRAMPGARAVVHSWSFDTH